MAKEIYDHSHYGHPEPKDFEKSVDWDNIDWERLACEYSNARDGGALFPLLLMKNLHEIFTDLKAELADLKAMRNDYIDTEETTPDTIVPEDKSEIIEDNMSTEESVKSKPSPTKELLQKTGISKLRDIARSVSVSARGGKATLIKNILKAQEAL